MHNDTPTGTPLYGSVSANGHIFALSFPFDVEIKTPDRSADASIFEGISHDLPVIDFRGTNPSSIIEMMQMTFGASEEYPPNTPNTNTLSEFLQLAQNAGATITTVGAILAEFKAETV